MKSTYQLKNKKTHEVLAEFEADTKRLAQNKVFEYTDEPSDYYLLRVAANGHEEQRLPTIRRPHKYTTEQERRTARTKSSQRWQEKNQVKVRIAFGVDKDKAIIDKLNSVPNKTDYIRKLILKDIGE